MRKSTFAYCYKRMKKERTAEVAKKLMKKDRHIRSPAKRRFDGNPCLAEWYFAGLAGSRNDWSSPRHEFDLCLYPLLRSSRCDRNIIDSYELSRSVSLPGCRTSPAALRITIRSVFSEPAAPPTAYFRDPPVLFSCTCWSLLNWRISLCDAAMSAHLLLFSLYFSKKNRKKYEPSRIVKSQIVLW